MQKLGIRKWGKTRERERGKGESRREAQRRLPEPMSLSSPHKKAFAWPWVLPLSGERLAPKAGGRAEGSGVGHLNPNTLTLTSNSHQTPVPKMSAARALLPAVLTPGPAPIQAYPSAYPRSFIKAFFHPTSSLPSSILLLSPFPIFPSSCFLLTCSRPSSADRSSPVQLYDSVANLPRYRGYSCSRHNLVDQGDAFWLGQEG